MDTTVEVMYTPFRELGCNPRFMRFYWALGLLKRGFMVGCRPIVGLDGCHTKGPYAGQLLTAMGVDPNNGKWPIAWAVIEKEAREHRYWFLELFIRDLEIENSNITHIYLSNKSAIAELLPNSSHMCCVQHKYRNFKNPSKTLQNMLWSIASSSNVKMYEMKMTELKDYDAETFAWVKKALLPENWCLAIFSHHSKCDMIVNNICVKGPRGEHIHRNNRDPHYYADPAMTEICLCRFMIKKGRRTTAGGRSAEKAAANHRGAEEAAVGGRGVGKVAAGSTCTKKPVARAGEATSGETNTGTAGAGAGELAIGSNENADGNDVDGEENNGSVLVGCKKRKTSQPRKRQILVHTPQPLVNITSRASIHTPFATIHKKVAQNRKRLIEADMTMINSNLSTLARSLHLSLDDGEAYQGEEELPNEHIMILLIGYLNLFFCLCF
ncbi:hypothetical protein ACH5RR_023135 [Cinchona calisaya]|uniref:MULE transposase domain-containing protein n=1 Tax=Cinchona calisaya TaxID=153742 RepID=A0ABD2ZAV3_9GENT